MTPTPADTRPIDPAVRVGHVHLKVADLERAIDAFVRLALRVAAGGLAGNQALA